MNFLTKRLSCEINAFTCTCIKFNANNVNTMFSRLVGWRKVVDGLAWLKPISPPSAADEEPKNMPF